MNDDVRRQEKSNRIKGTVTEVDGDEILHFYQKRAEKYKEENPYAVTMLQDNNPEIVRERNQRETEVLLPLLSLDNDSKILDVACGIGRWYDAIDKDIKAYCGIDFCEDLVKLAKARHKDDNADFFAGSVTDLEQILEENEKGTVNRVLMMGIMIYLNDADLRSMLQQICRVAEPDAIVCVREPIGIEERLTLKDFYSEELKDSYNAIYRTRDELMSIFNDILMPAGFCVEREGWLFEDSLNNRKETAQYYFVLRRNG